MKSFKRLIVATAIGGTALITNASIGFLSIDDLGLTVLSDAEMSTLRGGFVSVNDNVINIGLSVKTTINGETVLNTHVADYTISNGIITSNDGALNYDYEDPLKVIQYGDNNIADTKGAGDAFGFVVQNTKDNVSIKNEAILDIEADVKGFNRQRLFNSQLDHSLLHTGY